MPESDQLDHDDDCTCTSCWEERMYQADLLRDDIEVNPRAPLEGK